MAITTKSLKEQLKQDWAGEFISTNAKRIIITLPSTLKGDEVDYLTWDNQQAKGKGFLIENTTDQKTQFLEEENGILISYEGECPDKNGKMILRSEAIKQYLDDNPDAFSSKANLHKMFDYLQINVFKHGEDVSSWDEHARPDVWTSDIKWLKKNFNENDIYEKNGDIKTVISAPRVSEARYRTVEIGPNAEVEGLGVTGEKGSRVIERPDGTMNLCVSGAFNDSYQREKPVEPARIYNGDVFYPKGSMRHGCNGNSTPMSLKDRLIRDKELMKNLETPVLRIIGAALCDYVEAENSPKVHKLELYYGSIRSMDKSELKLTSDNYKVELLGGLLKENIIDSKGKVLDIKGLVQSDVIKNFQGLNYDLSQTPTMKNLLKIHLKNEMMNNIAKKSESQK